MHYMVYRGGSFKTSHLADSNFIVRVLYKDNVLPCTLLLCLYCFVLFSPFSLRVLLCVLSRF